MEEAIRDDEVRAIDFFRSHLLGKAIGVGSWWDGEDPPDFYITVDGERFAVEVTNLLDDVVIGGATVSRLTYVAATENLVVQIDKEARKKRILRGSYQIWVNGPFDDFSKLRKLIVSESLKFIGSTQYLSRRVRELPTGS